jgi:hypothetical protein
MQSLFSIYHYPSFFSILVSRRRVKFPEAAIGWGETIRFQTVGKGQGLFRQKDRTSLAAGFVREERTKPTGAPRDEFFPPHMSPEKTNSIYLR